MAPTIPTSEPVEARAGDTWTWKRSFSEYPVSEGWTLSYHFAGVDVLPSQGGWITNDGTATWTVAIPAASTAPLVAGTYQWAAFMTGSGTYAGRRDTVAIGTTIVLPNLATAAAGELRFTEEAQLEAIESVISGRITRDVQRVMIGSQQVDKIPIKDLFAIRDRLKRAIWRKQNPSTPFTIARAVLR